MPALARVCEMDLAASAEELAQARLRTDEIFRLVPEELLFERPIAERHRLAFYIGHLEAFDVNLLLREHERPKLADPLDRLFAFGIDPTDGKLPRERPEDWPPLDAIRAYADRARAHVDEWLGERYLQPHDSRALKRVRTAIEHRWMHAETLAYLLNHLPLTRPVRDIPAHGREREPDPVTVEAGEVMLGNSGGFGWDNEFDPHHIALSGFRIDRHMVTNGQFLRFIEAGGYAERRYWCTADW
ncbi:MAG: SUMF1/EgtB/PvdO family nonheme iron enzyme, partial [Steroidobacteraceae bacterium]